MIAKLNELKNKRHICTHFDCTYKFSLLGKDKHRCAHCFCYVCPEHLSPHKLQLVEATGAFIYAGDEPVNGEPVATTYAQVCEGCFKQFQEATLEHHQSFLDGTNAYLDPAPRDAAEDPGPTPLSREATSSAANFLDDTATQSAGDGAAASPSVDGTKKHLIILTHGVLGSDADWNNWIRIWNKEILVRNNLYTEPMHRSGSKLRLLRSGQKNTPPADARQSPGPRTPNPSSPLFPEPLGADPPTEQPSRSSGEREESPEEGETPHGGALSVWSDSPPSELSPVTTPTVATPQLLVNADAWGVSPTIPDVSFPLTGETASPTTGTASAPSFDKADSPRAKADPKSLYYEFFVVNLQGQTLKGIEALATQACAQVEAFLEKNPGVFDRFSIIGHSLGGIYPKYMLMLRHTCKAFLQLAPMNFVSLATPHLGSRRTRSLMSVQLVTKWFFSRTGRELLLEDKRRILPNITHGAIHELGAFRNLMAYANTTMDVIVPYGTSIIQVGKGLRTAACATGDRTIAAVHPHGVCSCFLDDGSAVPVKSDSELDSETETRDTDAAGEAKSEDVIPTIVMREYSDNDRHGVVSVVFDALEEPLPGEVYLEAAQKVPKLVLPANASKDTERDSSRPTGKQYSSSVPREANFQGEYIRIMFEALDSLPWTRVDVNIPNVKSHEHIILKSGSHNKALHKIIFHVIANFVW